LRQFNQRKSTLDLERVSKISAEIADFCFLTISKMRF
jgi:hypothetical protein